MVDIWLPTAGIAKVPTLMPSYITPSSDKVASIASLSCLPAVPMTATCLRDHGNIIPASLIERMLAISVSGNVNLCSKPSVRSRTFERLFPAPCQTSDREQRVVQTQKCPARCGLSYVGCLVREARAVGLDRETPDGLDRTVSRLYSCLMSHESWL